jgi:hypothetical protein
MADLIIAVSRTYPDRRQEFIELMSLDDESLMRVMRLVREREGAQADDR